MNNYDIPSKPLTNSTGRLSISLSEPSISTMLNIGETHTSKNTDTGIENISMVLNQLSFSKENEAQDIMKLTNLIRESFTKIMSLAWYITQHGNAIAEDTKNNVAQCHEEIKLIMQFFLSGHNKVLKQWLDKQMQNSSSTGANNQLKKELAFYFTRLNLIYSLLEVDEKYDVLGNLHSYLFIFDYASSPLVERGDNEIEKIMQLQYKIDTKQFVSEQERIIFIPSEYGYSTTYSLPPVIPINVNFLLTQNGISKFLKILLEKSSYLSNKQQNTQVMVDHPFFPHAVQPLVEQQSLCINNTSDILSKLSLSRNEGDNLKELVDLMKLVLSKFLNLSVKIVTDKNMKNEAVKYYKESRLIIDFLTGSFAKKKYNIQITEKAVKKSSNTSEKAQDILKENLNFYFNRLNLICTLYEKDALINMLGNLGDYLCLYDYCSVQGTITSDNEIEKIIRSQYLINDDQLINSENTTVTIPRQFILSLTMDTPMVEIGYRFLLKFDKGITLTLKILLEKSNYLLYNLENNDSSISSLINCLSYTTQAKWAMRKLGSITITSKVTLDKSLMPLLEKVVMLSATPGREYIVSIYNFLTRAAENFKESPTYINYQGALKALDLSKQYKDYYKRNKLITNSTIKNISKDIRIMCACYDNKRADKIKDCILLFHFISKLEVYNRNEETLSAYDRYEMVLTPILSIQEQLNSLKNIAPNDTVISIPDEMTTVNIEFLLSNGTRNKIFTAFLY
ncbi:MAG: hypothetical protein QG673_41 [Pseudomonadota bacterium]|nr:hypothetical protein [Pseudomonadota bacterium]